MQTEDRFNLEPGVKVMHDFLAPTGWQLPPARKSVSQMIAGKDVQGLTGLIQEEMGHYSPPGIHHRIEALLADGLINDSEFEQLLAHGKPENLERMLERIEQNERQDLIKKRVESTTFDDIEKEFPNEVASLTGYYREKLESLVNTGAIEPEDVKDCLRDGNIDELEEEIITRDRLAERERTREHGRTL